MRNLQKLPVLTIFCGSTGICTIVSARKKRVFLYVFVPVCDPCRRVKAYILSPGERTWHRRRLVIGGTQIDGIVTV